MNGHHLDSAAAGSTKLWPPPWRYGSGQSVESRRDAKHRRLHARRSRGDEAGCGRSGVGALGDGGTEKPAATWPRRANDHRPASRQFGDGRPSRRSSRSTASSAPGTRGVQRVRATERPVCPASRTSHADRTRRTTEGPKARRVALRSSAGILGEDDQYANRRDCPAGASGSSSILHGSTERKESEEILISKYRNQAAPRKIVE